MVLQIFTRSGCKVRARGKDDVLPQPDGSIVSGGTVISMKQLALQDSLGTLEWAFKYPPIVARFPPVKNFSYIPDRKSMTQPN